MEIENEKYSLNQQWPHPRQFLVNAPAIFFAPQKLRPQPRLRKRREIQMGADEQITRFLGFLHCEMLVSSIASPKIAPPLILIPAFSVSLSPLSPLLREKTLRYVLGGASAAGNPELLIKTSSNCHICINGGIVVFPRADSPFAAIPSFPSSIVSDA